MKPTECLYLYKAYKYVLGKLDEKEMEFYTNHLLKCVSCAQLVINVRKIPRDKLENRVNAIAQVLDTEKKFEQERRARGCLSVEQIIDYIHNRSDTVDTEYVRRHILDCEDCKTEVQIIKKIEFEEE